MRKAIIVDLDGTLCDCEHRVHHLHGSEKDWVSFFEGMDKDKLNHWCKDLIVAMKGTGHEIIIITGRGEEYRTKTERWLNEHDVFYDALYMRPFKDFQEDSIIKENLYNEHVKDKYKVSFVVDDRKSVVDKWRELGMTCLQCDYGDF